MTLSNVRNQNWLVVSPCYFLIYFFIFLDKRDLVLRIHIYIFWATIMYIQKIVVVVVVLLLLLFIIKN